MTDLGHYQDPLTIQRVLHTAGTIAIVGLSNNELRASYFVGYYLKRHGYRVIPVNPRETQILGETCYASLLDVPVPVDVVNVFRAPDALPEIARETVAIHAGALWCQFGVINEEGTVLGLMPHPERAGENAMGGTDGLLIFHSLLGSLVEDGSFLKR